jgi:hypothetical protein
MRLFAVVSRTCAVLLAGAALSAHAQSGLSGTATNPRFLNQVWTAADRAWFYTTPQGSKILPYDWFLALERPDSETLFRADSLTRFGYLPNLSKAGNPDGLPVGFVKDEGGDEPPALGMTCAACHTGQVNFAGKILQIDGAPTNADMFAFIGEMSKSLTQTAAGRNDAKFKRFAAKVLEPGQDAADEAALFRELKEFADSFAAFVAESTPKVAWGPARLDAFGMIFNRATAIDLNDPGNNKEPNAPVSYPFLWDTSWHNKVQWNGSADNVSELDRLGRNVGEVLGVFGRTDIRKTIVPPLFFRTSAKRINMLQLEVKLSQLRSPAWPQDLARIDPRKAVAGRRLYREYCQGCHAVVPRNKPLQSMDVVLTPLAKVQTDPVMTMNAAKRTARSGILEGVRMPPLIGKRLPEEPLSLQLVGAIVAGAILAPPDLSGLAAGLQDVEGLQLDTQNLSTHQLLTMRDNPRALNPPKLNPEQRALLRELVAGSAPTGRRVDKERLGAGARRFIEKLTAGAESDQGPFYKSRPLDGIWATAPYLHNGSVPNLYQLLLPASERVAQFHVGSREFDPANVGFKTEPSEGSFLFDTSLPGNSNKGHDTPEYGTGMSDEQRWQLIEYLKTL